MPQTKEQKAEYKAQYYQKHKEQIAEKGREYYEKNKEQIAEYYQKNKENRKEYAKTPNGKKANTIADWKSKGIKCDDFDTLYANYLAETHCDFCRIKFGKWGDGTGTFKCCDHDHTSGLFRNFLCCACNNKRG